MRKSILIVLTAFAVPVPAVAAAPQAETVSVDVSYGDLAVDKQAGVETLGRRVEAAIDTVCARPAFMRNLKAMREWQDCRETARSQAREQISPVVAYSEVAVASRF